MSVIRKFSTIVTLESKFFLRQKTPFVPQNFNKNILEIKKEL